jgi:tRNA(fMet)-specific endonuclease VapC
MACLDTSVVIDFFKGGEKVVKKLETYVEKENITLSSITAHEILFGSQFYRPSELEGTKEFLRSIEVLGFDYRCARISSLLCSESMKKGKALGIFDSMIAATAIANGEILVTSDRGFETINELDVKVGKKSVRIEIDVI